MSEAFERSIKTPTYFPLHSEDFHFINISSKLFWLLWFLRNPHDLVETLVLIQIVRNIIAWSFLHPIQGWFEILTFEWLKCYYVKSALITTLSSSKRIDLVTNRVFSVRCVLYQSMSMDVQITFGKKKKQWSRFASVIYFPVKYLSGTQISCVYDER